MCILPQHCRSHILFPALLFPASCCCCYFVLLSPAVPECLIYLRLVEDSFRCRLVLHFIEKGKRSACLGPEPFVKFNNKYIILLSFYFDFYLLFFFCYTFLWTDNVISLDHLQGGTFSRLAMLSLSGNRQNTQMPWLVQFASEIVSRLVSLHICHTPLYPFSPFLSPHSLIRWLSVSSLVSWSGARLVRNLCSLWARAGRACCFFACFCVGSNIFVTRDYSKAQWFELVKSMGLASFQEMCDGWEIGMEMGMGCHILWSVECQP